MVLQGISYFILLSSVSGISYALDNIEEMYGDEGSNLVLPCGDTGAVTGNVMWRMKGRDSERPSHKTVLLNNSLSLMDLSKEDSGVYTCYLQDEVKIMNRIRVHVRSTPPALVNVTVIPWTVFANLHWEVADTGGYPITHFTAQYRLKHSPPDQGPDIWHQVNPVEIKSTATQIDVFQLKPNSSYVFQIWANNKLGRGEIVELEAETNHDKQEIELAKHLLEGVETFDTRVWVAAVAVVMGTLIVLGSATIYILYKESHISIDKEFEALELIPNIILNPGYNEYGYEDFDGSEYSLDPDENSNDSAPLRLNNNTIVRPMRL